MNQNNQSIAILDNISHHDADQVDATKDYACLNSS